MSWNCPRCYRANSDRHTKCQGCGYMSAGTGPQSNQPRQTFPTANPQGRAGGNTTAESLSSPLSGLWRWLRGTIEVSGEVLSVTEARIQKPLDPYKILSLIAAFCIFSVFALMLVIGILVAVAIFGMFFSFLGFGGKRGLGGCSPFIFHMLLLRGFHRGDDTVPRLDMRLRDASGGSIDVVALGHVEWPAPVPGDEILIAGARRGGVVFCTDGYNATTGARLKVPGTNWRLVFFGLIVVFIVTIIFFGRQSYQIQGLVQ